MILFRIILVYMLLLLSSTTATTAEENAESMLDDSGSPLGVLYFLVAFTLGCFTLKILSRYAPNLPYTVVVFLEGLFFAVLAEKNIFSNQMGTATAMWLSVDPKLFLILFLPVLLFNECMELDTQLVKKIFKQALILATIGVLLSLIAIGLAQYYVIAPGLGLSKSWDLYTCLCLGSILSATDPVAVVTLLHHLGVSPVLTNQVSGESILNDGTAMVVYTLFADLEIGSKYTAMRLTMFMLRMCLLGPLVGIVVGGVALICLSRANRSVGHQGQIDGIIQLGVTIIAAYGSYYIADEVFSSSGVLAVSFAGYTMAASMKPLLVSPETIRSVWNAIEFVGNTLVFFISGGLLGRALVRSVQDNSACFTALGVMYLVMLVTRGVMLLLLWPFLGRIGPKVHWRSLTVIFWGGLRGAVALSLAVMVTKSEDAFPDVRLREELMFIVGGCACLTLLVNATTAHALVNILGFTELTTSKKILLKNVDMSIAEAAREMYDELLVDDEVLRTSCPKTLSEAVSTLRLRRAGGDSGEESPKRNASPRHEIRRIYSDIHVGHRLISPDTRMMTSADTRVRLEEVAIEETVVSIRKTLLSAVKAEYWDFMDLGLLPRNSTAAQLLIYSVDTAKQFHVEKKMNDWNKLRRRLESKERATLWRLKQKMRLSTDFASSWTELTVYVVDSFAAAHVRAQKSIARYYGHTASADTAEEWLIIEESKHEVREAKEFLRRRLGVCGERAVRLAHSKQLAQFILIHQKTIIETMESQGVVSGGDAEGFLHKIQSDLESLSTLSLDEVDSGCLEEATYRSSEESVLVEESEDTFESFPTQDAEGAESDNFLLTVIKSARICMLAHGEDLVDELEFLAKKILESPTYSRSWTSASSRRALGGSASPMDLAQPLLPEAAPSMESMPGSAIRTIARRVSTRMQAHRQLMRASSGASTPNGGLLPSQMDTGKVDIVMPKADI